MSVIPTFGKLKQGNCYDFGAICLGYIVSSIPAWNTWVRSHLYSFAFYSCDKDQDQKLLGRKGLFPLRVCSQAWRESRAGTWAGTWRQEEWCLLTCSPWLSQPAFFFIKFRIIYPVMALPTTSWVLPHQFVKQKMPPPPHLPSDQSDVGNSSTEILS